MLRLNRELECLEMQKEMQEDSRVVRMFIPQYMFPLFQMRIIDDVPLQVLNTIRDKSIEAGRDALVTAVEVQELVEEVLGESDRFLKRPTGNWFRAVCPDDYMMGMQILLVNDDEEPINNEIYTIKSVDLEYGIITLDKQLNDLGEYKTIRIRQGFVEGGNRIYHEDPLTDGKYIVCYMPNYRPQEDANNVEMYPTQLTQISANVYKLNRTFSQHECVSAHLGTMLLMRDSRMKNEGVVSIIPDPAANPKQMDVDISSVGEDHIIISLCNSDIEHLLTNRQMADVVSKG